MTSVTGHRALRTGTVLLLLAMLAACAGTPPQSGPARKEVPDVGSRAARVALSQVGVPYRYGGASPGGFDCSGLVQYSYRQVGATIPRTTGQLWRYTQPVSRSDLRPGDVLFFSIAGRMQHVGLYLGDGQFVHAPKSGRTVSVASLADAFYQSAFLRAGRPPLD